jgi:dethiobiotin synthetase
VSSASPGAVKRPSVAPLDLVDGVFVTGTGTEVGKTIVAGVIARAAAEEGRAVSVFKPAVSGLDELEDGQLPDHEHLRLASGSEQTDDEIAPYRYGPAVSPHLAADMAGEEVDADVLREGVRMARSAGAFLVCEGVGGFLVPLRADYLVRDFAVDVGLPVVVVASPGLGTINHALLTVESVRAAGLEVTGVVVTPWPEEPSAMERSNLKTISVLGRAEVKTIGRIDRGDPSAWPALGFAAG